MILLDATTKSLKILLGGAGAMPWVASWVNQTTIGHTPGASSGVTNGTTEVTIVAAPASGSVRQLKWFQVSNSLGAGATVKFRYDDNGSTRDLIFVLDDKDQLQYTDGHGFSVLDSTGKIKMTGGGGGASLTVEEVDGAPSVASTVKIKFAQADGFTVTDETGGVVRINVSAAAAPDISAQIAAQSALLGF